MDLLGTIKKLSDEKVELLGTIETMHEEICNAQDRRFNQECVDCEKLTEKTDAMEAVLDELRRENEEYRQEIDTFRVNSDSAQEHLRSLQIEQISLRNQLQLSEARRISLESQLDSLKTPKSLNSPFKPSTPVRPSTPVLLLSARLSPEQGSGEPSLQAQVEQTLEDIEALVGERELLTQVSHQALFRLSESNSLKRVTPKRGKIRIEVEETGGMDG